MELQNWERRRARLVDAFKKTMAANPSLKDEQIKLSWSNWGFGMEPLEATAQRLHRSGIEWIELHGNRYGEDVGYDAKLVLETLKPYGIRVAGVCGMFGPENDLSSNSGIVRQNAIDYIRRQLELCHKVGGFYLLVVPGAVGRPIPYDDGELDRSMETLRRVADEFVDAGVRGAVEPIRSAEVSFIHTVADAKRYIAAVDHPGIQHINGDVYHMQVEESNVAEAITQAGDLLINLHLADSNRRALGEGSLDLDAVLMALYTIGYTEGDRFATPEPLGPGGDPYPAMYGRPDADILDKMVADTATYWRRRETEIKTLV
jgi:sugar phosphate isomerase/epimerase